VHAVPSAHARASSFVKTHWPFAGLHASSVQGLASSQNTDAVPTHVPFMQASLVVHALPSVQGFALSIVWTHCPLAGLHESSVQAFPSLQLTGVPAQTPETQVSLVVHAFWSLQTTEGVPTQTPFTQASDVQALPSEQALALSIMCRQCPLLGLQLSSVQGF
jgi:hypothetical protein